MAPARCTGAFPRTGRGKSATPGFNVHSKIAPSPPSARRRRGGHATSLRAARRSVPAGAGEISMAARPNRRGLWGYAPACCGRLCQSAPSSTLAIRRLYVTKDGSPTRRRPRLWSFHATPQACRHKLQQGAFSPVVWVLALPASGHEPVKPSRGDAESAMSPFGTGGLCVLGLL